MLESTKLTECPRDARQGLPEIQERSPAKVTTRRTKALFLLSAVPLVFGVGAAAWAMIYAAHLTRAGHATYFVIYHFHVLRTLAASAALLLCALISLLVDRRTAGER